MVFEYIALRNQVAIRRTMAEIKKLNNGKDDLAKDGIYFHIDPDKLGLFYFMLIGSSDTPYEGGFYFFKLYITDTFPFEPPVVEFCSQFNSDKNLVRFNPNLYENGKVCLSILNTWQGPGWTSIMSIESICQSILSLVLCNNPLKNEPGYEHWSRKSQVAQYSEYIEHEMLRYTIYIIQYVPRSFIMFKNIMIEYFKKHYAEYKSRAEKLSMESNVTMLNPVCYGNPIPARYEQIIQDLALVKSQL